eukprot:Lankesteria_metandrocarpae@DN3526_c0_g1_i1.p1
MATKEQAAEVNRLTDEVLKLVDDADVSKAQEILTRARKLDAVSPLLYKLELYCCLQDKRWKDTLRLIQKYRKANEKKDSTDNKRIDTRFEESYAYYKLNQLPRAVDILLPTTTATATDSDKDIQSRIQTLPTSESLLAAQIFYRQGKFRYAVSIIDAVLKDEHGDVDEYLEANMFAASSGVYETETTHDRPPQSFGAMTNSDDDVIFNAATLALHSGELQQADTYLTKLMKNEITDPNILSTIAVQRAYLASMRGDTDQAVDVYRRHSTYDTNTKSDPITTAVSLNNFAVNTNSYTPQTVDGLKLMSVAKNIDLEHRMSHSQYVTITVNEVLALSKNERVSMAKETVSRLSSKLAGDGHVDDPRVAFSRAVIAHSDNRLPGCMIGLVQCFKSLPDKSRKPNTLTKDAVLLMLTKLAANHNAVPLAADCLSYADPTIFTGNPVRGHIAVMLLSNSKHKELSINIAMSFVQNSCPKLSVDDKAALVSLMVTAGNVAVSLRNNDAAYKLFNYVVTYVDSVDLSALAGLMKSAPESRRVEVLTRLTAALQSTLIQHDGEALEASVISIEALQKLVRRKQPIKKDKDAPKKSPVLRKARVPKNYDPDNPPKLNPERWLPKMERTENKKKKRVATAQGMVPTSGKQRLHGPSTAGTVLPEVKSTRRPRK